METCTYSGIEAANLTCGMVQNRAALLTQASAGMPGAATDSSKLRRAQRLLATPRPDVPRMQRRLLGRLVRGHAGRLELLLDAASTSVTAHDAGNETLCLSFAWHGRCIPLLWGSRWHGKGAHPTWQHMIQDFFAQPASLIPADTQVIVMADRGVTGRRLLTQILAHHWHYLLRTERTVVLRTPSGTCFSVRALVPHPGAPRRSLTGVQVFAPRAKLPPAQRHQHGRGTWYRVWSQAMTTEVVATPRSHINSHAVSLRGRGCAFLHLQGNGL